MSLSGAKATRLEQLQRQITQMEAAHRRKGLGCVTSNCPPLDMLLPEGGFSPGMLVEWLADGPGTGAATLAVLAARAVADDGRGVVVIDRRGQFYPPAALCCGLKQDQWVLVRTTTRDDQFWAIDQSLRCRGVGAVLAWPRRLDAGCFRRWQLAAEEAGVLGLLIRSATARQEPSWADVRIFVEPLPAGVETRRRLRVHLLRCRGLTAARTVDVEIDDETHSVYSASKLADSTVSRRAARA